MADDSELESLLADAFNVPPVPRSLLKRLDQGIAQEWGSSPGLSDSQVTRLRRSVTLPSQWARGLPVAAAVIVLLCVAVFTSSSTAHAWSTMLAALKEQGIVELAHDGTTRWLSLSDGVVSESSAKSVVLLDVNKKVVLRRRHDSNLIERENITVAVNESHDRLMFAFLAGEAKGGFSNQPATIADQRWQEVIVDGETRLQMSVDFSRGESHTFLRLLVDPETHLPVACDTGASSSASAADDSSSAFVSLTYPDDRSATRIAAVFPESIPTVDVSPETELKTALNVTSAPQGQSATTDSTDKPSSASGSIGTASTDAHTDAAAFADASKWKAVTIPQNTTGDAVKDLDLLMAGLWEENGVRPVDPASDEEILRRVCLDLAGRTPSVSEVREYLKNTADDRYEKLVSRLLDSPDHSSHLAARFRSFLIPEGIDLTNFGGIEAFEKWLAGRFRSGESYDKTVQSLLLAEGRLAQSGPLLFYSATKLEADQLAGRTARVFLGMRLECAQCHDHPFEPWTQEDFWGFAAFFARISRPRGKLENASAVMQVRDVDHGEVMMPESESAVPPKFLNSNEVLHEETATARRRQLTEWLTGRDNPYFARATANRVWSMMFGKGIVNPVDDFGSGNPPLSPELLDLLAAQFIQSNFDLKELFRVVALSKAYRLSSGSGDISETRLDWFAQMNVRMLTAEQVYDCITVATMPGAAQTSDMMSPISRFGNSPRQEFLREFRTPAGRSTEYQGGIPQALTLMNGSLIDSATGLSSSGLLRSLEAPFFTRDQRIEILYFATLSRRPKPSEKELLDQYITEDLSGRELREALSDVLWALLNSAEFTMNH